MVRVCLLAEGSYPYVAGGVSSWVNQLVEEIPEIEFSIVSIMPSKEESKNYKYPIHKNIKDITTLYIQDFKNYDPSPGKKEPKITTEELVEIKKFIRFDTEVNWNIIAETIGVQSKIGNPIEFLHSKVFWNMLVEYYNEFYEVEGFNEFFWTFKSMFVFFITIMQSKLPEADIYHAVSTGYPGLMGMIASKKMKKPFLLTEHGIYAREREEDIIKATWVKGIYKSMWVKFFYFISIGAYKSADKVIALFESNKDLQIKLGSHHNNTVVIPNGVDLARFSTEKVEHEDLNIGAMLRIVPIKDVKTLIRAFKYVLSKVPNSKLFLMGPNEEDKEYNKQCIDLTETLGITDKVTFTGKVDAAAYMKKMDILVLSSISEAQPLVILEGMSCEIPFVATDVGACRELLEGGDGDDLGVAGLVVKPVSPKDLGAALVTLCNNPPLREAMGKVGRKRVEKFYTKKMFIDKYKNLYNNIGGQNGGNRI